MSSGLFYEDIFALTGYYGLGPKYLPMAREHYYNGRLERKEDITILLNANGTVALEDVKQEYGPFTIEYTYEKAATPKE